MPSPDLSSYSGLPLYDRSAYDILQAALNNVATKFPGWVPHVGSYEVAILEAAALIASEEVYAINRLPDGMMEILMRFFGIERQLGAPPKTTVQFTVVNSVGYELPAGIMVRLQGTDDTSIDLTTDEALNFGVGDLTGVVAATATTNTDAFNGIPSGAVLQIVTPVGFLQAAQLQSVMSGGAGPETDDAWRNRAVQKLASLSSVLVLPMHFTIAALATPGIYRATTRDNWNVSSSSTGHVTVAVADDIGNVLTGGVKTALQASLSSEAHAALSIHVVDPDYNLINVTAAAVAKAGYSPPDVQAAAAAAVTSYLSPAVWPWNATVRINELISLIDQVEGVDYVTSVTAGIEGAGSGATDVALTGSFPLTSPNTISVTVTAV